MFTFADASPLAPNGGLADNVRSHHFVSGDRRLKAGTGKGMIVKPGLPGKVNCWQGKLLHSRVKKEMPVQKINWGLKVNELCRHARLLTLQGKSHDWRCNSQKKSGRLEVGLVWMTLQKSWWRADWPNQQVSTPPKRRAGEVGGCPKRQHLMKDARALSFPWLRKRANKYLAQDGAGLIISIWTCSELSSLGLAFDPNLIFGWGYWVALM